MAYEAYVLTEASRERLATMFPPKYPEWVGHHVTHRFGVPRRESKWSGPLLVHPYGNFVMPERGEGVFGETGVFVIGYAEEDGIEALVCTVDGGSKRPDGGTYHITWSLDRAKGKKPVDSNGLIARIGNTPCEPIAVVTTFEYI